MLCPAGSDSGGNTSEMEDQPIVKRRKKDSEPVSVVPVPPKPKMSALRRKEMRRERMEQKKQERLAKRKAEVGSSEFRYRVP